MSVSEPIPDLPLNQQAYTLLRRDILNGALAPELRLKTDELQKRYGLSSSPLREALSRLTQEGLVTANSRRGARVSSLSSSDFREILQLRLLVETSAFESSILEGTSDWEAEVVASHYRLEKAELALGSGPVMLTEEWEELHSRFHLALIAACPNGRQKSMSLTLFEQAERYRRISGSARRSPRPAQEHEALMNAALRRDAKTATALLSQHLQTTFDNVTHALSLT